MYMLYGQSNRGFTIIELLIVVIVISILATVTVVAYGGLTDRATDSSRAASANKLQKALENFFTINERYPTHDEMSATTSASLLGLTLSDIRPYGHTGYIEVNSGAINTSTGLVYLATTGPNFSGMGCGSLPNVCHYYQFSYWSKTKNQAVTFSNSR